MGYKCSFLDNQVYTAQDVNNVFSKLTSGGVSFADTGNALSDVTDTLSDIVTDGTVGDINSCRVILTNGIYKICEGTCFMPDGSSIEFDNEGHIIEVPNGAESYVYLVRNRGTNSIDIQVEVGDTAPPESVLLAKINTDGTVDDKRQYARSKVMIGVANSLKNFTVEFTESTYECSETKVFDIGTSGFSYIVMWDGSYTSVNGDTSMRVPSGMNIVPLVESGEAIVGVGRYYGDVHEHLYCVKNGSLLEVWLDDTNAEGRYILNLAVV